MAPIQISNEKWKNGEKEAELQIYTQSNIATYHFVKGVKDRRMNEHKMCIEKKNIYLNQQTKRLDVRKATKNDVQKKCCCCCSVGPRTAVKMKKTESGQMGKSVRRWFDDSLSRAGRILKRKKVNKTKEEPWRTSSSSVKRATTRKTFLARECHPT